MTNTTSKTRKHVPFLPHCALRRRPWIEPWGWLLFSSFSPFAPDSGGHSAGLRARFAAQLNHPRQEDQGKICLAVAVAASSAAASLPRFRHRDRPNGEVPAVGNGWCWQTSGEHIAEYRCMWLQVFYMIAWPRLTVWPLFQYVSISYSHSIPFSWNSGGSKHGVHQRCALMSKQVKHLLAMGQKSAGCSQ